MCPSRVSELRTVAGHSGSRPPRWSPPARTERRDDRRRRAAGAGARWHRRPWNRHAATVRSFLGCSRRTPLVELLDEGCAVPARASLQHSIMRDYVDWGVEKRKRAASTSEALSQRRRTSWRAWPPPSKTSSAWLTCQVSKRRRRVPMIRLPGPITSVAYWPRTRTIVAHQRRGDHAGSPESGRAERRRARAADAFIRAPPGHSGPRRPARRVAAPCRLRAIRAVSGHHAIVLLRPLEVCH
jgi:hypothetical protein